MASVQDISDQLLPLGEKGSGSDHRARRTADGGPPIHNLHLAATNEGGHAYALQRRGIHDAGWPHGGLQPPSAHLRPSRRTRSVRIPI
jgi:hypothetical protein